MDKSKEKNKREYAKKKAKLEALKQGEGFLTMLLSKATFAEKVEAIREVNPYFYLLTPEPYPVRRTNHEAQ